MSEHITKDNLFGPDEPKTQTKSEKTTLVARAIEQAAAKTRDEKTARLRLARLAMEARRPPTEAAPSRTKRAGKASKRPSQPTR